MKPQEMILIGSGGHALSLAEFASDRIYGYLSLTPNEEMPGKWLGNDEAAEKFIHEGFLFHMGYIYSGWPIMLKRRELLREYINKGAHFLSLISPAAVITPKSKLGEGVAVMAGAIVNRACLGDHVVVNSGAIVEHDCKVSENTFIAPGAVVGGFTSIGENCFIGLGARVGNGLKIADNITVAMGAVVNKNLTEPGIYHGSPLKHFKFR